jgi:release factor glutamine methyltransferase
MTRKVTTVLAEVQAGTAFLLRHEHVATPELDAEVIIAWALGCRRLDLHVRRDESVPAAARERCRRGLEDRAAGAPVAYVTGHKEFWGLDLEVGPEVLCPRPETEHLVGEAIAEARRRRPDGGIRILELGVGSGAVAIALARELPAATVVGTDVSPAALNRARRNAERLGVEIRLREGDLFAAVAGLPAFDLVVANPPYLSAEEYRMAAPEVRAEPRIALVAEPRATSVAERILLEAPRWLTSDGAVLLEVGHGQQEHLLRRAAEAGGYGTGVRQVRDLAGLVRVLVLSRR